MNRISTFTSATARFLRLPLAGLSVVLALMPVPALADSAAGQRSPDTAQAATPNGADLFRQYCMACHMADARGAQGAGRFPALAENPALTAAGYPIFVVLNGLGAMPWFNGLLSDDEIAAVVTYVRTHFGNNHTDVVKPEDVALMRGPVPVE